MSILLLAIISVCLISTLAHGSSYSIKWDSMDLKICIASFCIGLVLFLWLIFGRLYAKFDKEIEGPYPVLTVKDGDDTIQVVVHNGEISNLTAQFQRILPENSCIIREREIGGWANGIYWLDGGWYWSRIQPEKKENVGIR